MKERIKQTFFALNHLIGVSGAEQDVIRYCLGIAQAHADIVTVMPSGNLIATFESGKPGHSVMITAHADEVGYIIKHITRDGFLLFERAGNPVAKTMPARRLLIQGQKGLIPGIIGLAPGHVQMPEEAARVFSSKESYIDVGARSAEAVAVMGIEVGSVAVPEAPASEMHDPDLLSGRAVDNRAGCAVLLELCREMPRLDFVGRVHLVFSVQEEIGVVGAKQASDLLRPDYCIVLDTFPAGGTPDVPETRLPVDIGKGPVLSYMDTLIAAMTSGYVANKRLTRQARQIAEERGIPLQCITMCEDMYGTDAIGITNEGNHAPCISLGIPRRYSHSPFELFDVKDAALVYELTRCMVEQNGSLCLDFLDPA